MSLHEETHTIRCLPDVWKQLSIKTALEGTNNSAKIRELIEEYLQVEDQDNNNITTYQNEIQEKVTSRGYITPGYVVHLSQKHKQSLSEINQYCKEENIKILEY